MGNAATNDNATLPTRTTPEPGLPGTTTTPTTRREPDGETRRWGDKETATAARPPTAEERRLSPRP